MTIPPEVAIRWEERYAPAVVLALVTHPAAARELVSITGVAVECDDVVAIAVTLHTTADPVVPFEQQALYGAKVGHSGAADRLTQVALERYGLRNFETSELLDGFATLIGRVPAPLDLAAGR